MYVSSRAVRLGPEIEIPMAPLIAIVDADRRYVARLAGQLQRHGYRVVVADALNSALRLLTEHRVSILLTELRIGASQGIELVEAVPNLSPGTRVIVMSAEASAEDYKRVIRLGAVELLTKPFSVETLITALGTASDSGHGFRGSLHGIELVDVLQLLHVERRSVSVQIGERGRIYMQDGEIVDATLGPHQGEAALGRLLSANSGLIQTGRLEDRAPTINKPFAPLILDTLRQIDEQRGARSSPNARPLSSPLSSGLVPSSEAPRSSGHRPIAEPGMASGRRPRSSVGRNLIYAVVGLMLLLIGIVGGWRLTAPPKTPTKAAAPVAAVDAATDPIAAVDAASETVDVPPETRKLVVRTEPAGLELVDAKSGASLGRSPITVDLRPEDLPLRVRVVIQGQDVSTPLLVTDELPPSAVQHRTLDVTAILDKYKAKPKKRRRKTGSRRRRKAAESVDALPRAAPSVPAAQIPEIPKRKAVGRSGSSKTSTSISNPESLFETIEEGHPTFGTVD